MRQDASELDLLVTQQKTEVFFKKWGFLAVRENISFQRGVVYRQVSASSSIN